MQLIKEKIVELECQLIEAIKTGDITFIENVLHDDLLFLAPNGQVVTKEMDLTAHQSKQMIVEQLIPTFEDLNIIGETAISVVVYDTKGVMLGQSISGQFRYIRNWKVFNESLQIVSGACVQIS
jgi:ketosteroid isomerase-like protein